MTVERLMKILEGLPSDMTVSILNGPDAECYRVDRDENTLCINLECNER